MRILWENSKCFECLCQMLLGQLVRIGIATIAVEQCADFGNGLIAAVGAEVLLNELILGLVQFGQDLEQGHRRATFSEVGGLWLSSRFDQTAIIQQVIHELKRNSEVVTVSTECIHRGSVSSATMPPIWQQHSTNAAVFILKT